MEYLNIIITSVVSLIVLFLLTKLEGAKQISELTMFDYIISISIGSIAAEMSTEIEKPLKPLLAMVVYGVASWLIAVINGKSIKARKLIIGHAVVLIHNGKMCRDNFKKNHIDLNEFLMQARTNGYFDISAIQTAILETSGKISFLPYSKQRPVTPQDMNICPISDTVFYNVIMDGIVIEKSLIRAGKDINWLNNELKVNGVKTPKEVFLATLNTTGTLNIFKSIDLNSESPELN